ncbi:MAG: PorT family protein [Chitinophagaceae bacterium]|nr:PorT family protein [Chitinophagaceae bacterium]HQV61351.1 porin family protein [Chitinophagaceae bacterium]HQV86157.1 porin family protein [Chitinophagaceae bacterium]HQX73393.1 porin family protein [Chitinophagaceae bacterium]HQZ75280.1 porin family protein [Chitinophagaceae bacterium]
MKTKFLSLFAAVLLSQAMMAQFHLGVKAGANITKVDGKSFKDEFRYGYHLGGFAEIRLGNKLVLQPEVLFNQYATRLDSNYKNVYEDVFDGNSNIKLNYLSVPVLLNYKLVGNFISLQAGPQFGVLLDQNKTLLQNGGNAFKSGDLSMLAGVLVRVGPMRINGRYAIGLNNISDIADDDKWKNQGFQVSVGLAL